MRDGCFTTDTQSFERQLPEEEEELELALTGALDWKNPAMDVCLMHLAGGSLLGCLWSKINESIIKTILPIGQPPQSDVVPSIIWPQIAQFQK